MRRKADYSRGMQKILRSVGDLRTMQNPSSSCILNHMPGDFLARLKPAPVLCDGAMGTLLYSKGIFINRCYDELNLSQPDLIRGIHHEYLQAGAEIIETNTFGANSFRLGGTGCRTKLTTSTAWRAAGARKRRRALTPGSPERWARWAFALSRWAKCPFRKHATFSAQQIAALIEGGVDLLILETFGYLEELHQAILAAREVRPEIPDRRAGHDRRRIELSGRLDPGNFCAPD